MVMLIVTMDGLVLLSDIISYIISITYLFFRFTIEGRDKVRILPIDVREAIRRTLYQTMIP